MEIPEDNKHLIRAKLEQYKPQRQNGYVAANVLVITWQDDSIGCADEVDALNRVFHDSLGYGVWPYKIPSLHSQSELNYSVATFIKSFSGEDKLLIVYYGGHAGRSPDRTPFIWAPKISGEPNLDWSAIQPSLLATDSDVVIILDCCYAGQAARPNSSQRIEFLTATDKDKWTPTGKSSFTSFTAALTIELTSMIDRKEAITTNGIQKILLFSDSSGLLRQPFRVSLSEEHAAGPIILPNYKYSGPSRPDDAVKPATSLHLHLSFSSQLDTGIVASLNRWLTKDSPRSIANIQLTDHALSEAIEANKLGLAVISGVPEPKAVSSSLLPSLPQHLQQEAKRLLQDLQTALSTQLPMEIKEDEALAFIDTVKEKSALIVEFVKDSLARLDESSLAALRDRGKDIEMEEIRKRITMRLTLLSDSFDKESIRVSYGPYQGPQRFRVGEWQGSPVLVEYVHYDGDEDDESHMKIILTQIQRVSVLHSESKDAAFRSLPGLGFTYEKIDGLRFGLVHKIPEERVDSSFSTLSEIISKRRLVSLDERVRMARVLCDAVLNLHSIGWFHKAIKSENVLVFEKQGTGDEDARFKKETAWDFENPFLMGFDSSRPSDAETRGTVDHEKKANLYRHPDRWGRSARFERHHDIYALGLLLLEIGCWKCLPDLDPEKQAFNHIKDPEKLRHLLLGLGLAKTSHHAGKSYSKAVEGCLKTKTWTNYEPWEAQRVVRHEIRDTLSAITV